MFTTKTANWFRQFNKGNRNGPTVSTSQLQNRKWRRPGRFGNTQPKGVRAVQLTSSLLLLVTTTSTMTVDISIRVANSLKVSPSRNTIVKIHCKTNVAVKKY